MCRPGRCCAATGRARLLGSGSDAWKYWDERAPANLRQGLVDVEGGIARSYGTCMTMGTAATMMAIAETLGMTLPGASSIPAPTPTTAHGDRMRPAHRRDGLGGPHAEQDPDRAEAFLNAITVAMAMGCSTNAMIHLIAMARRAGQKIGLDDFDARQPHRAGDRQHPAERRPT
jgi:dihydroxy-acid dehydratase